MLDFPKRTRSGKEGGVSQGVWGVPWVGFRQVLGVPGIVGWGFCLGFLGFVGSWGSWGCLGS